MQTRILIVDDDLDILDSLKDIFEIEIDDCIVSVANNVNDAKEQAKQFKPDIALIDIKIGKDNGLDLIPEIKSIQPRIVIVMMTAFRDTEYTIKAVRFGANDYLYKPIKPTELIQTVTRLLQYQSFSRQKEEADQRFHTIFEQSTQWLFLLDKEGHLIDANQTAMSFIDKDKDSVVGKPFWISSWFNSSLESQKIIQKGLSDVFYGALFSGEFSVQDGGKNRLTFDFYMKPVFDEKNEVCQIVVESRDITDRKKAEDEIKELNLTLESRVKERTLELEQSMMLLQEENKERKHAEEKAKVASKAKSDFLSRMSHELRTPMNAILGFAQLLEIDANLQNEQHKSSIKEILDAGNHLLALINEVLDLTAIESGKLEMSVEEVKLDDVVKECTSLMQPLAESRQIKLINNISGKNYILNADFTRLKQVLLNLLSNAVKYNNDNGTITLDADVVNENILRISITDTGEGLTKEDIGKLFSSFERLNTQFNVEGTGIGLVISKNLIELMAGRIGVESVPGEGSTFWIEIGLTTDKEKIKIGKKQNSDKEKSILYIDDDPVNLALVKGILKTSSSHTFISADNAIDGLALAEEKQPDLILMDINMPGMNGFEALEALKKNKTIQHIPVLALTGNNTKGDVERGKSAGFKEYITKPFKINVLLDTIEEYTK